MTNLKDLQEELQEYFKHIDDSTFVQIVTSFAFFKSTDNTKVRALIEKFLEDNDLTKAYSNYYMDLVSPNTFFNRSSLAESNIIENIRLCLLALSHNRFIDKLNQDYDKDYPISGSR